MNYFFQKIISKKQPRQALASSFTAFCQHQLLLISIIIDSGVIDHFFINKNLIINYKKYQYMFETGSGKKFTVHDYGKVIL